jgi:Domain of unknown function (DUF4412)
MKIAGLLVLTLVVAGAARADFSYVTATKGGGQGPMAAMGPQSTKQYFKGQKMKTESGDIVTLIDFEAKTVTMIHHGQKSYTVSGFGELAKTVPGGMQAKIDLKETGQKKTINGFNASQAILTMEMDGPGGPTGTKMQMEMELWVSSDVPGAQELKAFYTRNAANFPYTAMAGGGNSGMQKSMAELQKKMASLGGVAVQQIIRVKPAGGGLTPSQAGQLQAAQAQAMAQLEALRKQGGAQGKAAEDMLARMGGRSGAGGGALFEMTMESTDFSTAAIPDSVFAMPAGYQKR